MADSVLPASRVDALLVIVPAVLSLLFGVAPRADRPVARVATVLFNAYAAATSVLTFLNVREEAFELYADTVVVLYTLLVSTILSSAFIVFGVIQSLGIQNAAVYASCFFSGLALALGLLYLHRFFLAACVVDSGSSALCDHDRVPVAAVFTALGVGATLLFVALVLYLRRTERQGREVHESVGNISLAMESPAVALMGKTSALSKAAVVGAFWFLADGTMTWGDVYTDGSAFWWITGQVVKHISALVNIGLNHG